jgi:hypothetical protein
VQQVGDERMGHDLDNKKSGRNPLP